MSVGIAEALRRMNVPSAMWRATVPPAGWAARQVESNVVADELRRAAIVEISELRNLLARSVADQFQIDLHGEPEDPQTYKAEIDATLDIVRRAREFMAGEAPEHFARLLDIAAPELASEYRELRSRYIDYALDTERVLVFFGAGTDEDSDRFPDLIPSVQ